jgi:hypothetical protein
MKTLLEKGDLVKIINLNQTQITVGSVPLNSEGYIIGINTNRALPYEVVINGFTWLFKSENLLYIA